MPRTQINVMPDGPVPSLGRPQQTQLPVEGRRPLQAGQWFGANHQRLDAWLADVSKRTLTQPKVAVFDFDNTSIYGDIGTATARYMLDFCAIQLAPEALAALIPEAISGITQLAGGHGLPALRADILTAYSEIWPRINLGDVESARRLPAHRDFRARMLKLYDALEATPGLGAAYAYPWLVKWAAGHTSESFAEIGRKACKMAQAEPKTINHWTSATNGRTGPVRVDFEQGLAGQAELVDLMARLGEAGVKSYIVTASPEQIVAAVAPELGYPVAGVYGMRLAVGNDGKLLPRMQADYPTTNGSGKVDLIKAHLPAAPLLVAGDSDGDHPMMTHFPETEVRLVFNRNKPATAAISAVARDALTDTVERTPSGRPRFAILQGRDEQLGTLRAATSTRPRDPQI